ncbi:hypothetical protein [Salinactinospora qingdaonensis]|uniref:EVE domain-containing protein n=1 Tax=Salinactinospora qingdaonensis TaxID=702744 RepID=A0ABP7FQM6_9ACTN
MSSATGSFLMIIGDREALAWVLATRQTAFPAGRAREASGLAAGDSVLLYTTRGCFRNPSRDRGRIIAHAAVAAPVTHDDEPVEFGGRGYPLRCPLHLTELAPFGAGVVLADHVTSLYAFPNPKAWSIQLRRPLLPLNEHDHAYLTRELTPIVAPVEETIGEYLRVGVPPRSAAGER